MKKNLLLLFIIVSTFSSVVQAQNDWINYKIDGKLSVKLPKKPTEINTGSFAAVDKDSSIYCFTIIDFVKVSGIDSAQLVLQSANQDFANDIRTGMLQQMPGFTLGDIKIGKWERYTCYNIEGSNPKLKLYTYMIVIGSKMYSFITIKSNKIITDNQDAFFRSVVLN